MSVISQAAMEESGRTVEKLRDLLGKAEKGEKDAVPEIRQILDEVPIWPGSSWISPRSPRRP
jgi:hypothetical protein